MKRQLAIDCGQKGFRYISYCHCASSVDLQGEIDVLQDCFYFLFFCPTASRASGFGEESRFSEGCSSAAHRHKPPADGGKEELG